MNELTAYLFNLVTLSSFSMLRGKVTSINHTGDMKRRPRSVKAAKALRRRITPATCVAPKMMMKKMILFYYEERPFLKAKHIN